MKRFFKWISVIFTASICLGLMFLPSINASAETAAPNDNYVYYAQAEDEVLTAYSTTAISEDKNDVVVQKETSKLAVDTEYAFSLEFKNGVNGKVYVELAMDGTSESLRVVQITGKEVKNLDAKFMQEKITFFVDEAGTYAVIDINTAASGGFAWYHGALIGGIVIAVALCAVAMVRRKK